MNDANVKVYSRPVMMIDVLVDEFDEKDVNG